MVSKRLVIIWENDYRQITWSFKANFLLCLHLPPPNIIEIVNKMVIDFVWNHKKPKIRKDTHWTKGKEGVGPA